ncbi:MAG: gephyrin-like molybdotransferase Glp [Pseudomonadota bacterium]
MGTDNFDISSFNRYIYDYIHPKPLELRNHVMLKPFFRVSSTEEARNQLARFRSLKTEITGIDEAIFRVLSRSIKADQDSPPFDRSTMDGFALTSSDTFGSSESSPSLFNVVGEILMGQIPQINLQSGDAVRIWTGGAMPTGADAVVMIEHTQELGGSALEVVKAVAPFDNMVRTGEDYKKGEELLKRGLRLRSQDIGLLASLGVTKVEVHTRPRVALISSGDEITPVEDVPAPGCVRDVNRHSLYAGVKEAFAQPKWIGLAADTLKSVKAMLRSGLEQADIVVISGGSSMGSRDYVIQAISEEPVSRILIHGVSMSPGKPIIIGSIGSKPVIGLPGHPISALVCFDQFVIPIIRRLAGEDTCEPFLRPCVKAFLTRNVSSKEGRQDFIRITLSVSEGEFYATPLLAKSGMVSAMSRTHGFVKIPADCEGLYKGQQVNAYLYSNCLGGDFEKEYFSGNETTKRSSANFNGASRQEQLSGFGENPHS